MTKIALGTWAWGTGAFGGDKVFGSKTDVENLKPLPRRPKVYHFPEISAKLPRHTLALTQKNPAP